MYPAFCILQRIHNICGIAPAARRRRPAVVREQATRTLDQCDVAIVGADVCLLLAWKLRRSGGSACWVTLRASSPSAADSTPRLHDILLVPTGANEGVGYPRGRLLL